MWAVLQAAAAAAAASGRGSGLPVLPTIMSVDLFQGLMVAAPGAAAAATGAGGGCVTRNSTRDTSSCRTPRLVS